MHSLPARMTSSRLRMLSWLGLLLSVTLSGCSALKPASPRTEQPTTSTSAATTAPTVGPGKYHHRFSQFVFYSDFQLNKNAPIFQELAEMREQLFRELHLPPSNTIIQVFLFEDQEKYERYMRTLYPDLPVRRAFFIKQGRAGGGADDLFVFTYWGEHIHQDLRHELTHGILHSVLKDVPLWLDEGLAELYELPPERNGVNAQHLEQLRRGPVQPDLGRLEQLQKVEQMQRPEYREAWAWVHMMLRGKPECRAVLVEYMQQLRNPQGTNSLLAKLKQITPNPNQALAEHLSKLEVPKTARANIADR